MHYSLETEERAEALSFAHRAYEEAAKYVAYVPKGRVVASYIQSVQAG